MATLIALASAAAYVAAMLAPGVAPQQKRMRTESKGRRCEVGRDSAENVWGSAEANNTPRQWCGLGVITVAMQIADSTLQMPRLLIVCDGFAIAGCLRLVPVPQRLQPGYVAARQRVRSRAVLRRTAPATP
jgi:hypothetical protein